MDAATRAVLNETENLLIAETGRAELTALDEDAAIELEARIRRARNKYVGQYRRAAATKVAERGGRGAARPENAHAARKAEAFELALSRVSRRVSALARQSAATLRAERLAQARAAKRTEWPLRAPRRSAPAGPARRTAAAAPARRTAERNPRTPASERARGQTRAAGARQQTKRDTKRAAAR
jgi:hypothetical protein